jgi:hypothetical protein
MEELTIHPAERERQAGSKNRHPPSWIVVLIVGAIIMAFVSILFWP